MGISYLRVQPHIPEAEYANIARFLEAQGFKEEALAVTTDLDHKFDLSMQLNRLDVRSYPVF